MNTLFPIHDDSDESRQASQRFPNTPYRGLLVIGDPHLEGRVPGFRKDEYPQTILSKMRWCLNTARKEKLLPLLLGDLFQLPRDNPNWLITELIQLFEQRILGIYGNHDVHENQIDANDTLSILDSAGCIELLSNENCFRGVIGGRNVLIGGTSWGQPIPSHNSLDLNGDPVVVWLTHHDLAIPGYDAGKVELTDDLPIDLIINGHIHRRLERHAVGKTTVVTPGNISRRKRSDATRSHVPSVLVVEFDPAGWDHHYLDVPHQPYEEVFHAAVEVTAAEDTRSDFVSGLAELQARRTDTGAGLSEFLSTNLQQFEPAVAQEIQQLADEILEKS